MVITSSALPLQIYWDFLQKETLTAWYKLLQPIAHRQRFKIRRRAIAQAERETQATNVCICALAIHRRSSARAVPLRQSLESRGKSSKLIHPASFRRLVCDGPKTQVLEERTSGKWRVTPCSFVSIKWRLHCYHTNQCNTKCSLHYAVLQENVFYWGIYPILGVKRTWQNLLMYCCFHGWIQFCFSTPPLGCWWRCW